MATSSFPRTPDILFSSVSSLMPIRLDSTNFFVWKYMMTTIFRAHNLMGYVDGSIKSPEKLIPNDTGAAAMSPSYRTWMAHDAGVTMLIHVSLSSSALPLIVDCDNARELWLKLEENYSSLWNFHVAKFRSDLETVTKGGDSVHAYVLRIEEIRYKLAGFDVVVDDAEMMVHAQRGLPTEYNDFRASMAARNGEALSLDGFYVLLLEEEAALRARSQYQIPQLADAQWNSNLCQICNEAGHVALVRHHRMDFTYQGVQNQ